MQFFTPLPVEKQIKNLNLIIVASGQSRQALE